MSSDGQIQDFIIPIFGSIISHIINGGSNNLHFLISHKSRSKSSCTQFYSCLTEEKDDNDKAKAADEGQLEGRRRPWLGPTDGHSHYRDETGK